MRLQAHGLLNMPRVANAIDSSTVSTGSEQRRLDPTGHGQVNPFTVSIRGPDPAFSMDSAVRRRLDISAASSPSAEGSLSATFEARSAHAEGVHPRLAIQ